MPAAAQHAATRESGRPHSTHSIFTAPSYNVFNLVARLGRLLARVLTSIKWTGQECARVMTAIFRVMCSVFQLIFSYISRGPRPGGGATCKRARGEEREGERGKHLELPTHPHVNTREFTPPHPPHSPMTHILSREEGVIITPEKARQKKTPHC